MNKTDIVKLALAKQTGKTSSAKQPEYLTKNGSIFNAPNTKQTAKSDKTSTSDNIAKLNNQNNKTEDKKAYADIDKLKTAADTKQAIADLKEDMQDAPKILQFGMKIKLNKLEEKHNEQVKQELQQSRDNLKSIAQGNGPTKKDGAASTKNDKKEIDGKDVSASEGRAMAKSAEKDNAKLEKQTSQTKQDAKVVNNYAKDAKKTGADIKKEQAKLSQQINSESAKIAQNQTLMASEAQKMNETQTEIDALQMELDALTAGDNTGIGETSAFSLKLAGEQNDEQGSSRTNGASDDKNGRIAELQAQISAKSGTMKATGTKLQKLQTTTNKSITVMHNKVRIKGIYYQKAQKTMQAQQKDESKIMKVAQKIDDISQTVQTVGKTLQTVGKGMILAGQALAGTVFGAAAGAALISAGGFTEKAGTVTELVGQYGSCAANITKTACNVAEGNFAGALQSVGSAIQSGAAAAKGTQGLKDNMKAIDAQVAEATQKMEVNVATKDMMKNMSDDQIEAAGGKKAAKATIKNNLTEKMNNGEISIKNGQISNAKPVKMGADGKFELGGAQNTPNLNSNTPTGLANGVQTSTTTDLKNMKGGAEKTSFGKKLGNAVKKGINQAGESIKKAASNPDTLMKIGKEINSLGAKMATGKTQQGGRAKNYALPQYSINSNRLAQGEKMMKRIASHGRRV